MELLLNGVDHFQRVEEIRRHHQYWSGSEVSGMPGRNDICGYCCLDYKSGRKYGGFIPFIDPVYYSGIRTLYGCECCRSCYQILMNTNVSDRFSMLFSDKPYRGRKYHGDSIIAEAVKQGCYPPEYKRTNIATHWVDLSKVVTLGTIQCVHISLIRWSKSGLPSPAVFKKKRYEMLK